MTTTIVPNELLNTSMDIEASYFTIADMPESWPYNLKLDYVGKGTDSSSIVERVNLAAQAVYDMQVAVADLQQRVEALEQSPYASLMTTSSTQTTIPANSSVTAAFNSSITGRGITSEENRLTPEQAGVFRISSILAYSARESFNVKIMLGDTVIFTFNDLNVTPVTVPSIDMPITTEQQLYVSIENTQNAPLAVNQLAGTYLNISRTGL